MFQPHELVSGSVLSHWRKSEMSELLHTLEPGRGGGDVLWGSEKKAAQMSKEVGDTLKNKSES